MKRIFFVLIFFVLLPVFGQNYQTFKSNEIHYFKEAISGKVLASEIVDSRMLNYAIGEVFS